ncbi:MAG: SDR family NAD(P)-dependent oxidoreductase [Bacteroidota bacterium]
MKKTILITGSTDGIGKLAAQKLAAAGHRVYLHGRSQEKLLKVIDEIRSASNNENVNGFTADFSDLTAVRQMAKTVKAELGQLDVLINNAGVFKSSSVLNSEGYDLRFVVNYFAPYLLTTELLSLLEKSEAARLINLSSAAQDTVVMDALLGKTQLPAQTTYAQSKLALTMWSFHLAQTLPKLLVIPVNPGSLLNTNMVREAYGRYWSSADKGAEILIQLAVDETYAGRSGQYFDNDKGSFGRAHPDAYDSAKIEELIRTSAQLLL